MTRRVAIGRFHDGSAKVNWGGRATSMALAGLMSANESVVLTEPINGTFITTDFTARATRRRRSRVAALAGRVLSRWLDTKATLAKAPFGAEEETADRLLHAPHKTREQQRLIRLLEAADEFWMNGEGDFILTHRPSLFRTMVMMAMARQMGKRVRLLNSILSESPKEHDPPRDVRNAVARCLAGCDSVAYRDPTSLELHGRLFGGMNATWCPDALFSWATEEPPRRAFLGRMFGPDAECLPFAAQRLFLEATPYVAVSGSSTHWPIDSQRKDAARRFAAALREHRLSVVFVATDSRDDWLKDVAASADVPFVPARVPLVTGRAVLAGASAFVSGRYHPSILAAGVGVPTVFMESNSHKTRSLQKLLGREEPEEHSFFGESGIGKLVEDAVRAAEQSVDERRAIASKAVELGARARAYFSAL